MRVDPANAAAVQPAFAHEGDIVGVGEDGSVMHLCIVGEQRRAGALVANEQLAVHEVVAANVFPTQQPAKFRSKGFTVR